MISASISLDSPNWQYCDDEKRGPKYFYITGYWTATGHCRKDVDITYRAGKAGKAEILDCEYKLLPNSIQMLHKLSVIVEPLLIKYKPKLYEAIQKLPPEKRADFLFNSFHMFIGPVKRRPGAVL